MRCAEDRIRAGTLLGRSEDVVLVHQAWGREVFALGALRAARWLLDAPPGLYSMEHLLRGSGMIP
jgi:4-hydroxy-tetrahydrodipicolinate reductase